MNPVILAAAYLLLTPHSPPPEGATAPWCAPATQAPVHPTTAAHAPQSHLTVRWKGGGHPPPRHSQHWHRHNAHAFEDER